MPKYDCIAVMYPGSYIQLGKTAQLIIARDTLGRFKRYDTVVTGRVDAMERTFEGALVIVTHTGGRYLVLRDNPEATFRKNSLVLAKEDSPENFLRKQGLYQVLFPGERRVTVKCLETGITTVVNCSRLEAFK